jgi:hypothetical protein
MAQAQKLNLDALNAFSAEHRDALVAALTPLLNAANDKHAGQQDALGNRNVTGQADQQRQNSAPIVPTIPAPRNAFSKSGDDDCKNALRLAFGTGEMFHDLPPHGENVFYPSFHQAYAILDICDQMMISTKRFYDSAAGWHPLVSRYYLAVLFHIQVFRSMQENQTLFGMNKIIYDQFCNLYAFETLPIPGPLVPFFQCLNASAPSAIGYDPVYPTFSQTHGPDSDHGFHMHGPHQARTPSPIAIRDQYKYLVTALTRTNADDMMNWKSFVKTVAGVQIADDAANNTDAFTKRPLDATNSAAQNWIAQAPGLSLPIWCSHDIAQKMCSYRSQLVALTPAVQAANAANTPTPLALYLGLENPTAHRFFTKTIDWMTAYSKFFKGSIPLSDVPHSGHTAGQINFVPSVTRAEPTTLFPDVTNTLTGEVRNLAISHSDALDSLITLINIDNDHAGNNDRTNDGPFFRTLPSLKESTPVSLPSTGYGSIIKTRFHLTSEK